MSTKQTFRSARRSAGTRALVTLVAALCALPAGAGPNEQAKRIFDRIAGVPPSATELGQMATFIQNGDPTSAANIALQAPQFYNTTLKNFAMPWTNRDQTVFAPLNDYVATFIGMVRDDVDFSTALSADILYTSNAPGLPPPSAGDNNHYATAESQGVDMFSTLDCDHAVGRLRHTDHGDRGSDDDARLDVILLHQWHQPRHVPLHADGASVQ